MLYQIECGFQAWSQMSMSPFPSVLLFSWVVNDCLYSILFILQMKPTYSECLICPNVDRVEPRHWSKLPKSTYLPCSAWISSSFGLVALHDKLRFDQMPTVSRWSNCVEVCGIFASCSWLFNTVVPCRIGIELRWSTEWETLMFG